MGSPYYGRQAALRARHEDRLSLQPLGRDEDSGILCTECGTDLRLHLLNGGECPDETRARELWGHG
jgi:hypothetical protein